MTCGRCGEATDRCACEEELRAALDELAATAATVAELLTSGETDRAAETLKRLAKQLEERR